MALGGRGHGGSGEEPAGFPDFQSSTEAERDFFAAGNNEFHLGQTVSEMLSETLLRGSTAQVNLGVNTTHR